MKEKLLPNLCCPDCQGPVDLPQKKIQDGKIKEGQLYCHCCNLNYEIRNFIPRFVSSENYTRSFGYQWLKFARTQIDKFNGTSISRDRFYRQTGWTPEELRGKLVLEAGCGAGRFTEIVLETGAEVFSFDYSQAVDACLINHGLCDNLHLTQADIYKMPFLEASFDKVFCFGVLQHTPNPFEAFKALTRMVKPGGELVIDVYIKTPMTMLHPKYYLRGITTRMDMLKLYQMVEKWAPRLLPISDFCAQVPLVGRYLRHTVPVANYRGKLPLKDEQLKEWAILDTFDWLSPKYDLPQTIDTINQWFASCGFDEIRVQKLSNIVGRGRKP